MRTLLFILLLTTSTWVNAEFEIEADIGRCDASGLIEMCNEDMAVAHVHVLHRTHLNKRWSFTMRADHFSHFDGGADLHGDEARQTGSFNYFGIGLSFRF